MNLYKSKIFSRLSAMLVLLMAGWAPQAAAVPIDPPSEYTDFANQCAFEGKESGDNIQPLQKMMTVDGNLQFIFNDGGNDTKPAYWYADNGVRTYVNNTVRIVSLGNMLNRIDFKQSSNTKYVDDTKLSVDKGKLSFSEDGIVTWSCDGKEINELTLTVENVKGNQFRFKEMTVVYDGPESGVTPSNDYTVYYDITDSKAWTRYLIVQNGYTGDWYAYESVDESPDPANPTRILARYDFTFDSPSNYMTIGFAEDDQVLCEFTDVVNGGVYTLNGFSHKYGETVVEKLKAPVFTSRGGSFTESFVVGISHNNGEGYQVYYTLDGSDPDTRDGILYDGSGVVIPEGADVTLKAIVVNAAGDISPVTSATYTFVPTKVLTVKVSKPGALSHFYIQGNTVYDSASGFTEKTYRVPAGDQIYVEFSLQNQYKANGLTFAGTDLGVTSSRNIYKNITMPDEDAVLELDAIFNPESPADPSAPVQTYSLTVVYNPVGAHAPVVQDGLKAGEKVNLYSYVRGNANYSFTSFTRDGEVIVPENGSYYLEMPASDVVVMANFVYCPSDPDDPQQPELKRPVVAVASPAGACSFSINSSSVAVGKWYTVTARMRSGYVLTGWILNGERLENVSNTVSGYMTEQGVSLVALCKYDPSSPDNPGSNHFNDLTGHMIVDDFNPGALYDAVSKLLTDDNGYYRFDGVTSIIVKGKITSNDLSVIGYMANIQSIDLSRTYGVTSYRSNVFANLPCSSLIIPSDVTQIDYRAFSECYNLVSLSVHATVPPVVSGSAFSGFTPGNCVLRVPEESLELYRAADVWKDFADIVPLGDAVHVLEVQLPYAYRDGRLKNNRIELVNTASGRRQTYVITERPVYTFNGVMKDEQYMVLMVSETGLEMARITDILIPDADHAVAFTTIKEMCDVNASVVTPDSEDVTSKCVVEWYEVAKDESRTYLRKAQSLGKVPEGQSLVCKVTVDRDLALKYQNPEEVTFTVEAGMQPVAFTLEPLRTVVVTGKVVDEEGNVPAGASVNIRQQIAGKYDRSTTASVDKEGVWSSVMYDAPLTTVTYSATESLSRTDTVIPDMSGSLFDLGEVVMRSNVGARISYALSYIAAVRKGETPVAGSYSDIDNLTFKVYNENKKRQHPVTLQRGVILVLDQDILPTDSLTVTVSSLDEEFLPTSVTVEAGESLRPSVEFNLVGKGGIYVSYGATDSPAVAGMLYNADGKLIAKGVFSDAALSFSSLDDGEYSVVAMTRSDILNSSATLAAIDELGLVRDKDYVMKKVSVAHGVISDVEFKTVPSVDESLFTFTSANTSITPNKTSVTTGQYLTIKTILDFKTAYKGRIENVVMEFDIPDRADFVDASMMKGANKFGYDLRGNTVVVDCGKNYAEQLRFCVMPNSAGEVGVVGRVSFDLDGQRVSQPIGTASAISKSFDFNAPVRTCYNQIVVSGAANANSTVKVFQDGKMIGEGKSSQGGSWTINCEMVDTYHLSEHQLQAVVTTPEGVELKSGTRRIVFDGHAVMIDRVTMLTGSEEVVFDFNGINNTQSYTWVDDRLFTFIVKLSDNAPEKISDVILYVRQLDGETVSFNCYYSESRDAWLCVGNFTSSTAPINVAVSIINAEGLVFDRAHFDETIANGEQSLADAREFNADAKAIREESAAEEAEDDAVAEALASAVEGIANLSGEELSAALASVLAASGVENSRTEYDESLIGNEEEIDRLLEEGLRLLLPAAQPDYNAIEASVVAAESLMAELDIVDDSFEIDTTTDGATFQTETGEMLYEELSFADLDLSAYDPSAISELILDDGSKITVVANDDVIIIADESKGKAWKLSIDREALASLRAKSEFRARMEKYIEKIKDVYDNCSTWIGLVFKNLEDTVGRLSDLSKSLQADKLALQAQKAQIAEDIARIDNQILHVRIQSANANGGYKQLDLTAQLRQLEAKSKELAELQAKNQRNINRVSKALNTNKAKFFLAKGALDKVSSVVGVLWKLYKAIDWAQTGIDDHKRWEQFIASIMPCPDDYAAALALSVDAEEYSDILDAKYGQCASMAAGSSALSAAMLTISTVSGANPSGFVIKAICEIGQIISEFIYEKGKDIFDDTRNNSRTWINKCIKRRRNLKCHQNDPNDPWNNPQDDLPGDPEGSNRTDAGNNAEKRVAIDPAGYVYEGVHSNRVEGVQATAYYREEVEDMYGDKHLNEVLWNAEEYAQQNPLFTDAEGMYAWDVPPGEWRVKFEKDGYNTSYSEWLPVPPPQLEVNVEITQNAQPEVKEVHAYAEGVDIAFDKYMDPESLTTANIFVSAGGDRLEGSVEHLDAESVDPSGLDESARTLVSKVRFVPEQSLSVTTGKVRLTINRDVKSYAGIPMTETYTQEIDVEKEVKDITVGDDLVKVLYGGDKKVTLSVVPSEAGMGRTVRIANSSPMITNPDVEEVVLDELGQAEITLSGDMPGTAVLTFSIDKSDKTGEVKVNVLEELIEAEKPTASRASGSVMYRNEKVELKSESKGAVIYFTTDGTDPADPDGLRRKYSVPVVLDQDLDVKAVAEVDGEQSEVSSFSYTVKRSAMDFRPDNGWNWISHNFEEPVRPAEIAADNVKAILSQTDEVVADPKLGLIGTLTQLDAAHSYKVQADGAASAVRVETYAYNPANPIQLFAGWNWLGYPVDQELSIEEAFANADFKAEDMIVGQDGAAQFDGENWIGTLNTLKPGAGYMMLSKDDVELVYNNTAVSDARSKFASGIPYKAPWAADIRKYPKAMVIVAEVIDRNGARAEDNQWYVGAFSGSECRGVGRWVDNMVMMNVFGNTGDDITLRLVNAESAKEIEMTQPIGFSESVLGSVLAPYQINVDGLNGVKAVDSLADGSVRIVDGLLVAGACDALDIFDTAGVKVISIANYDGSPISLDALMKGVHVVALRNGDNYSYAKIMVK